MDTTELSSYDEFPFHEFYYDESSSTATFCLFGASRSGKSTLIQQIWKSFFTKHITVMFLDNPKADAYNWARKKPKKIVICQGLGPMGLMIIDMARFIQATLPGKFKWCFILDDVLDIRTSKAVNELLMSLRNVGISTILSIQDVKMLSVAQRNNCNNILCGFSNTPARRRVIVEEILGRGFLSEGEYSALTKDHGWMCRNCVMDGPWFHVRLDLGKTETEDAPEIAHTIVADVVKPEVQGNIVVK